MGVFSGFAGRTAEDLEVLAIDDAGPIVPRLAVVVHFGDQSGETPINTVFREMQGQPMPFVIR
jgi:hypothetical protein